MKIGLLATLEGPSAAPGQDGMRGADLALKQKNGMAGGKKIEFVKVSSDATPDKAVAATRKAVEQDKVQIMIGPLSGDEGVAVKNYAKTQPNITFVNGSSGAQATTLVDPAPNFYRFNTEGAQWMVGLGEHALGKGYKKMFLISEDYGFPYSRVQGFMASYCAKGGKVVDKVGAAGHQGLRVGDRQDPQGRGRAAGGAGRLRRGELPDAVRAGRRHQADGRRLHHRGPDGAQPKGKRRESLLGTASAGPMADSIDTPEWKPRAEGGRDGAGRRPRQFAARAGQAPVGHFRCRDHRPGNPDRPADRLRTR